MSRTALAHTDASIAYSGTWATNSDTGTFTGSYRVSVTSGDTITITVPSTATAVILKGLAYHNGVTAVQVQSKVAGVVTATTVWNLWNQTAATSANYWWYRSLCQPIFFTPGASNTIVITVPAGGRGVTFDGYEWYVAESPTANRLTAWGHSWVDGFALGSPSTQRYSALIATALGMTEDNQGVDNNDLTNGTNSAVAVNDVWTISTGSAASAGTITISVTAGGSTQTTGNLNWNAAAATVQTAVTGLSNVGSGQCVASGTTLNTVGGIVLTIQGTLAGITITVNATTTGTLTGGALALTHTTSGQGVNKQYSSEGNAQPGWMQAELGTGIGLTWPRTPALFLAQHGTNDRSQWGAYDLGTGGAAVAGVGYSQARFIQRYKEVFWRVKALVPTCELWAMTQPPPLSINAPTAGNWPTYGPIYSAINAAIVAAAADPTVGANVVFCESLLGLANGGAAIYTSDHPNSTGHTFLYLAFMDAYRRAHPEKYGAVATAFY